MVDYALPTDAGAYTNGGYRGLTKGTPMTRTKVRTVRGAELRSAGDKKLSPRSGRVSVAGSQRASLPKRSRGAGRLADELRRHLECLRRGEVLIIERVRHGIVARMAAPAHPALSSAERAVLEEVDRELGTDNAPDPVEVAASEFNELRQTSYSTQEAAAHLGVTEGRVRQMLTASPPSLLGLKRGRAWRLPRYHFSDSGGLVPGVQPVIESVPTELHPVAVWRWFVTPCSDLEGDDETPLSPLNWLRTGRDPSLPAQLARDLA